MAYPQKINRKKDFKINGSYVVVRVLGTKSTEQYFIGFVASKNDDIQVKFLKRCGGNKFTFPDQDDIAYVAFSDVIAVLTKLTVNNRHQYILNSKELYNIKNLY